MRDFKAEVDIYSEDNDKAGFAFHIVDEDNYYFCRGDEQFQQLEIGLVYKGSESILRSVAWNGNWNSYVQMDLNMF
jgi:hypothetical protein